MNVTVVGLGKIGLPLAVQFAKKGAMVFGVDINPATVQLVNSGLEPFPGEANLREFLSEAVQSRKLHASTSTVQAVSKSDVVIVVVPLFIDKEGRPDFNALDSATIEIAKGLKKGTLIAFETTLPIGTTRNRFTKVLEEISSLTAGQDFWVVFSPERVLTGRIFQDLGRYPKIVGGLTDRCSQAGKNFYESMIDFDKREDLPKPNGVWIVDSCEAAELVKLAETTYRDVNIALANQFAKLADAKELNIYKVIEAANSQTYSDIHNPGVAVGGHCIPVYPHFYLLSDPNAIMVSSARAINKAMPEYSVSLVTRFIGEIKDRNVLILGVSYRSGVKESAFSGVFELVQVLERGGANVTVWDPLYSDNELLDMGLAPFDGLKSAISLVFLQTDDSEFFSILTPEFSNLVCIFDGRNMFKGVSPIQDVKIIAIGLSQSLES
jgi:nucleotide sugar dehydrogenase